MKFAKLIRLLVFRTIKEEKFLALLSVIGVALAVALFIGVKVATDRAISTFESDIQGINPHSSHEISHISGIDFVEDVYGQVRGIEEDSFPLISATGYLPVLEETIDVKGIYTVKMLPFLRLSPGKRYDMEAYFRDLNGVLITKRFAKDHHLDRGDILRAYVYDGDYALKIVDLLDSPVIPTNTVIMDLGNFQDYFGKVGYLTKIDLASDESKAKKIGEFLPTNLSIEKKEKVIGHQKSLVSSFRYNLLFVSLIAVLVGVFLLYNTIFVTVVKRRREIGILRGLGIGKKTVIMVFSLQGVILGIAGSLFGIVLGQFFAYFSILAIEKTMATVYSGISISDFLLTGGDALKSLLLGLIVSLAASLIPAYESSKIKPNEAAKEGSLERKYRKYQNLFSLIGVFSILLGGFFSYLDYRMPIFDFPYLAYVGILLFIQGFTLISPHYLWVILKVAKGPAHRLFKGTGKVAVGSIDGSLYRFSAALMSVAISSALVFALLTSIFSLRSSLTDWINRNITADIYVKPASCVSNYCFFPLSSDVVAAIEKYPEVESVDRLRTLQIDLYGKKVVAGFGDTGSLRYYDDSKYFDQENRDRLKRLERNKEVSISDYLSINYGLKKGDPIELVTPKGKEVFTVNNSFISYSTTSGFIYLDRRWLKRYWGLDDATQVSIYLKKGNDVSRFVDKLRNRFSGKYSLEITNNRELRETIVGIFNRSFAITYAIEVIAILVSLIGMINALLVLVLEKKREISVIRYIGGTWRQIKNMIVLSAGIIGFAGIILGAVMGPAISWVIIHVINRKSFGWEVAYRVPVLSLTILMVIIFLATIFAGNIPSNVARKLDPKAFISFE